MIVQFRLRRADAVEWATIDPVLQDGEPGWEQDTNRIKMGDGVTPWNGLGYATYPATEFEQMIGDITQNLTELDASVAKAADSALTATTQANAAAASAVDASTSAADAEAAEVRVTAIGATNDTQTASFVNNPASSTSAALTAKYAGAATNGKNAVGKGELVFRVTDPPFNAPIDGVANSTNAINAAGLAAFNAGRTGFALGRAVVEFPWIAEGYTAINLITLYQGVTYRGDSQVVLRRGGTVAGNYLMDCTTKSDVTIEGLTLDSNGKITNGTVLFGTRTTIRDCTFIDTGGIQLPAAYATNVQAGAALITDVLISRCRFVNMRNNIHVKGNTQRVTIEDNDIGGFSSTAIAVDGDATTCTKDLIIRGNRVHDVDASSRAVTTKQTIGNVATLTLATDPDPRWVVGQTIWVDIGDANYDFSHTLTAVDVAAKTISWARTAADSGPAATTGYVATGNRQPISVQSAQSGVLGVAGESSYHERVLISGNQVLGNYVNHQATANGGTADCISAHHTRVLDIVDNIVEGSGDCGIVASYRAHIVTIAGNTVVGASGIGIAIGSQTGIFVKALTITGNTVVNCGQGNWSGASAWASAAINLRVLAGCMVEGNYLGDVQAVPTQKYGITVGDTVGSSSDVKIGTNQYVGNIVSKRLTPPGNVRLVIDETATTVTKTADTASNLDATPKNDPHLLFACEANSVYEVEGVLGYNTNGVAGATPGMKIALAPFAGSSIVLSSDSMGSNGTGAATTNSNSNRAFQTSFLAVISAGGVTGATPARILFKARLTVGAVAGNFQLTLSQQNTDAVNAATLVTGSYMTYKRVA